MELSELIVEYRRRTDDNVEEYHTSDVDLARFATEAEKQACQRAHLLYDDSSDFTTLAIVADQSVITLDPLIDRIDAAWFTPDGGGRAIGIDLTGIDWIREQCDWQTRSCSRPWKLAHIPPSQARLYPLPSVAGTLQLAVFRHPLYAMEDGSDEPEIDEQHHIGLIDWMVYRAVTTKDVELSDPGMARDALAAFESRFGTLDSADVKRRHNARRRITTRPI